MKIATFNVNSVKARLPRVLEWLSEATSDVALLQEIKTQTEAFPYLEIEELGYNTAVSGQKSYNGVAILSKRPIEDVLEGLPGDPDDDQARYVEATIDDLRVASIYLPNGNPIDTEKFPYKLGWMDRLHTHVEASLALEETIVFGGDYNVIPKDDDVYNIANFATDALVQPESRARFQAIKNLGLTDALRSFNHAPHQYFYWDYQRGAWQQDNGVRIDHLLLSPMAADRLVACEIDKGPRGQQKASDHTPVWCELED